MYEQYPHTVTITDKSFASGGTVTVTTLKGRRRPITTNRHKEFDSQGIEVKWIVYFPLSIATINLNAEVEVKDSDNNLIVSGTVKQFSRHFFNARIWI